jgi:hypothetical protein
VASSALAVGFLLTPFLTRVTRPFLYVCVAVLLVQVVVGLLGAYYHLARDLAEPPRGLLANISEGAPPMAPLLFPNLVLLALLGLWQFFRHVSAEAA